MKKKISIILYGIASFLGLIYWIGEITPNFNLSETGRLFLLCGSCFFLYLGGLLLSKIKANNKPMKINLWIFFALYVLLLVTLTLFDSMWGRNGFSWINWFHDDFLSFVKHSMNLIPFKTIMEFAKEFNSMYSNRTILLNLFGNFIALMPMAFFLPLLFPKQNKFKNFFWTSFFIVLGIELTQLLTASGRFDIDDIILNVTGATVMYFILKIKEVDHLIKNIFLLENNPISKKSYLVMTMSILLVILGTILLVKFRSKLYRDNLDQYNKIHNPSIAILDESENVCDPGFDLFYEDDLYRYYFPCRKSDNVYAIINQEEKYLVKDFMKNETYHYSIDRMLSVLDFYEVKYVKENKYPYILLSIKVPTGDNGSFSSPNIDIKVEKENLLDTRYDYENDFENATFQYKVHLIPKVSGTTKIEVSFTDHNHNLLGNYQYTIQIDEKLNLEYQES